MTSTLFACTLLIALAPAAAQAQIAAANEGRPFDSEAVSVPRPVAVTPALDRAVALGIKKKNANHALVLRDAGQGFANAMAIMAAPRWSTPATKSGLWLEVYTPLSWVSQQAAIATREYREFFVTPEMVAPIVRIYAHPDTPDIVTARGAAGTRSVQRVVMQNHRRTVTVQPLSTARTSSSRRRTPSAARLTYTGQEVTFALDDVHRLFAEGEFDIIVVGTAGEKRYTVKRKHFERLPM